MLITYRFIVGACIASFFNLVIIRTLNNESIITPRSHCDNCSTTLKYRDLIPIVSFIILVGKCRFCKAKIPITGFISEIVFGFALSLGYSNWFWLIGLFYISLWDVYTLSFPSWTLLPLLVVAILYSNLSHLLLIIIIYMFIQLLNQRLDLIGNGDIDLIFIFLLASSFNWVTWIIFVACILAIIFITLHPLPNHKLPFVPFLSTSFFLINIFMPM